MGARNGSPATPALLTYVPSTGGFCLVRADGSHAIRLTPRWKVGTPSWSPRGRYIAFGRATGSESSKMFVADARGRIRWHFGGGINNGRPLWSPDGREIAYVESDAHVYGLAIARMDGSRDTGVATSPGFPTYGPNDPAWVPGGQRLAFDDGDFVDVPQGIYTVALDGSDRRLLTGDAIGPAFSPDGTKLAYIDFRSQQQGGVNGQEGIFVADADGTNPQLLAPQTGQWPSVLSWSTPAWSPDGTRLAFAENKTRYGRVVHTDLIVERADGTARRVLASAAPSVGLSPPVWSPGGKFLAFRRYSDEGIVVVRADGGGRPLVVAHSGTFAWRPAVALPAAKRPPCPTR